MNLMVSKTWSKKGLEITKVRNMQKKEGWVGQEKLPQRTTKL